MFVAIVTDFEQNVTSWIELLDKNTFWKYLLNRLKYLNLPTVVNSSVSACVTNYVCSCSVGIYYNKFIDIS